MKPAKLLIGFLFFLLPYANAQDSLPPVYEIKTATPVEKLDDRYWQLLVDSSGKWAISDVSQPPVSLRFRSNNTRETGVGYAGIRHYWQRLRLKNLTGKDQRLVIFHVPWIHRFDVFVFRASGKMDHLVNGWSIPASKRDSFSTRSAVPVEIAEGEEIIVYKKSRYHYSESARELTFSFTFFDHFIRKEYINRPTSEGDVRNAFITGILILAFFLNLFFYLIARERVYFWYAVVLLLEGVWYFVNGTNIFFRESAQAESYFQLTLTHTLFWFSVVQFVRYFLKTFQYFPRWDKMLLVLTAVTLALPWFFTLTEFTITFENRGILSAVDDIVFFVFNFSLLVSFFLPSKEKDRFTMLSIIAAVPTFFVWSFVYGIGNLYQNLGIRYDIQPPPFIEWLNRYAMQIEMVAVGWFAVLFTWILLQRYALLRKQYTQQALERERERLELMSKQKDELERQVEERTAELKQSLEELRSTQKQLIQSEKMASLGELTAGIAHEIQNPLNFINNFSEVSSELADELVKEVTEGNTADVTGIAADIKQNLDKIVHHGRRADSIVKNMLQHSRQSTGDREATDLNALVDECLRLSYHGLRAKDKLFNAMTETHLDPDVGKVDVVRQDLGRVLLNLFNNAFYSVTEKKKLTGDSFQPTVQVTSKRINGKVELRIKDNGMGIPARVVDKIYQPFFTTKPSGEGTGLGLSLSYDVITKVHGGELNVDTREGEFAEFIIQLPVKENA